MPRRGEVDRPVHSNCAKTVKWPFCAGERREGELFGKADAQSEGRKICVCKGQGKGRRLSEIYPPTLAPSSPCFLFAHLFKHTGLQVELVKCLLEFGADANVAAHARDSPYSEPALHVAARTTCPGQVCREKERKRKRGLVG